MGTEIHPYVDDTLPGRAADLLLDLAVTMIRDGWVSVASAP
ncbi:hypothetical protein [Streptomyces sp. WAC01280]|nr:hypothetical protein [Streptomyces sp. WAC01280]